MRPNIDDLRVIFQTDDLSHKFSFELNNSSDTESMNEELPNEKIN